MKLPNFVTVEPKVEERTAQPYMGVRVQVPMQQMDEAIPQGFDEVFAWLGQRGAPAAGAPFIRYHVIDMDGLLDIEMGVPVADALEGDERVKAGTLPAGRYAALTYAGLDNGIPGNAALLDWGAQNGLVWDRWDTPQGDAFASRVEFMVTDPDTEPDTAKWLTEVAIRLVG